MTRNGERPRDYPPVNPIFAGVTGRCPRCGRGRLYRGYLKVAPECEACGLDLARENVGDGAVPFLLIVVCSLGAAVVLWMQFTFDPPVWVFALVLPLVIMIPTLALLPPFKGVLIALQYHHRAGDTGRDTF